MEKKAVGREITCLVLRFNKAPGLYSISSSFLPEVGEGGFFFNYHVTFSKYGGFILGGFNVVRINMISLVSIRRRRNNILQSDTFRKIANCQASPVPQWHIYLTTTAS